MSRPVTPPLLTAQEVADRLRTSIWTVMRACRSGELRASKPRGTWLVSEADLATFVDRYMNDKEAS